MYLFLKKTIGFLSLCLLSIPQARAQEYFSYTVQEGDCLSTIARDKIGPKVYDPKVGSLKKLLSLNPKLKVDSILYAGSTIYVPKELSHNTDRKIASSEPTKLPIDSVPLTEDSISTPNEKIVSDYWIWFGYGANFTSHSQSIPSVSELNFGKINTGNLSFRSGFFFDDHYGLDLQYKETPSEASSSPSITVIDGKYKIKNLAVDLLFRPAPTSQTSAWLGHIGVQKVEIPFVYPNSSTLVSLRDHNMTNLNVGLEYRKKTKKNIRLEILLNYLHKIGSDAEVGSEINYKQKISLAGRIGASYQIKKNLYLGTAFSSRYQKHSYLYRQSNGSSFFGTQSLLSSSIDLHMGVEF